jgi:hypothetical protein
MSGSATYRKSEEVLIEFQELHGGHTGKNLAQVVWSTLKMYGITEKVHLMITFVWSLMTNLC